MTHKKIIRRQLDGTINDDSDIPRIRKQFEHMIITSAIDEDMVRHLDINPEFSLEYTGGSWKFLLTIHFVKVSPGEASKWQGVSDGKLIAKPTHQSM